MASGASAAGVSASAPDTISPKSGNALFTPHRQQAEEQNDLLGLRR